MSNLPELTPGYAQVPSGHIASVVTFLEMTSPPEPRGAVREPVPYRLERMRAADLTRYRDLFRAVGAPWLWFSRLRLSPEALALVLGDADVEAYAVCEGAQDIGLLELDFRVPDECELAYFGLVADRVGQGLGRGLMREVLARAWHRPIRRLHVHTCTLDHPQALAFYQRAGFTPYRRAVEVAPDPRLTGDLPRTAGAQVPLLADH
ncbi:MAG: GNAT family N-acetyltransferase [Gemmatimonas sp.]|jgi:GNAT superfamily N-acetyltransferase|uniref:GNAT family N-acetyltransferase n=2 Tax=Gemmatimonas sp. TaxID=1962908 RepID=UPI0022CB6CEA|nr:GNAT family N-acetyltransferase [Gemmatimonas sp.]MCA2982528.1 GNAT family N-acetyltransferase [Gemmatimonas sp.]MCA2987952.1 GNAT family N-acetyltransferase [Gemmatimonas sp.]MCA2995200.1 GNAT family N-acetyltransferase [Gemmatimonas sp.]MCE2952726.1 GNAT family N-acetyltransferase [Gemmatimonas sp.]MCZ8010844.1 GNAT family N-acetyltransferase [Gemmatimonas sp.]